MQENRTRLSVYMGGMVGGICVGIKMEVGTENIPINGLCSA